MIRTLILAAPLLLLAACGDEAETGDSDARSAAGEVLEGSVSDEMIPYDTLRSQPPLAEIAPEPGASPAAASAPEEDSPAAEDTPATEEQPGEGE